MYSKPSSKRRSPKKQEDLNLVPILDAVFIFIFFLLFTASFTKYKNMKSIFPIASSTPIISDKPKLNLIIEIEENKISIYRDSPSVLFKEITKENNQFDFAGFHQTLVELKKEFPHENTAILIPKFDYNYEQIVDFIDKIRLLEKSDHAIYIKNKDGTDQKSETLFGEVIFGNIMSENNE